MILKMKRNFQNYKYNYYLNQLSFLYCISIIKYFIHFFSNFYFKLYLFFMGCKIFLENSVKSIPFMKNYVNLNILSHFKVSIILNFQYNVLILLVIDNFNQFMSNFLYFLIYFFLIFDFYFIIYFKN